MCQFKSFIITEDSILYSLRKDSHTDILEENNISDISDDPKFIRVEFVPQDNIFNLDLSTWKLIIDQDFIPDWFFKELELPKIIKIMENLIIPEQILINIKNEKIENKKVYIKNSSVEAWENSSVEAWGNSSVVARENSSVVVRENSSVEAWGNSSVVARGNSSVVARENSSVVARGNSSVVIPYSENIIIKNIYENGSVRDLSGNKPIIYLSKDNNYEIKTK